MILPTMVAPVGLYLMRTYMELSIPRELVDAARIDGASELRIFFRIALPLMVPWPDDGAAAVGGGAWNNYFLPLIIFSNNKLFPVTVGMGLWSQHAGNSVETPRPVPAARAGRPVMIIPMIAALRAPATVLARRPAARQCRQLTQCRPINTVVPET